MQLANGLSENQNVRLGAKLKIPTTKLANDETTYWFVYVVKSGDSLGTIAARFKVEVADVLRVNGITDASRVLIDQQLIIPVKTPRIVEQTSEPVAEVAAAASMRTEPKLIALIPPEATPTIASLIVFDPATTSAQAASQVAASATDFDSMKSELLALYNEQRAAAGLPTLQISAALVAAAQAHAEDCAVRGFGSHTGSDGSTSRTRITRAGFNGEYSGENWAYTSTSSSAFNMWFYRESPGGPHRRNIMSTDFNMVGFGIAPMGNGYFFIANFGG